MLIQVEKLVPQSEIEKNHSSIEMPTSLKINASIGINSDINDA